MQIKVSEIVSAFLNENNLGQAEYAKAYRIAIRGWRQLNWDITGKNVTKPFCIDSNKTANLPDDCISVTEFGVDDKMGGIATFTKVNSINECSDFNGRNDFDFDNGLRFHDQANNYDYLNLASLGVGSYTDIGYYSIDEDERTITVAPNCEYTDFLIKYLKYQDVDGEYTINELAQEALLGWIDWRFHIGDRRIGTQEKREREAYFYNEKRKAKLRIKKLPISSLNRAARQSVKMGVKS